ncbi:MAG: hypothetical protein ABIH01_04335 [Candidatus Omnitrophota bacterium]
MSRTIFIYLLLLLVLIASVVNYAHKYYYIYKEKKMMEVALDIAREMLIKMQREREKFLLMEARIVQLLTDNEILKGQKDSLVYSVENLKTELAQTNDTVNEMNKEIVVLKKNIEELKDEKLGLVTEILSLKAGTVEVLAPDE